MFANGVYKSEEAPYNLVSLLIAEVAQGAGSLKIKQPIGVGA
jgi:hypothetical protein